MKTLDSEQIIFFDVDNTLLMHGKVLKGQKAIHITDPYDGHQHTLRPHAMHIKVLKDRHARGATIFVWSKNGGLWAQAAVRALKLESYVSMCLSKPVMYVDDLQAHEILGERLYIPYAI